MKKTTALLLAFIASLTITSFGQTNSQRSPFKNISVEQINAAVSAAKANRQPKVSKTTPLLSPRMAATAVTTSPATILSPTVSDLNISNHLWFGSEDVYNSMTIGGMSVVDMDGIRKLFLNFGQVDSWDTNKVNNGWTRGGEFWLNCGIKDSVFDISNLYYDPTNGVIHSFDIVGFTSNDNEVGSTFQMKVDGNAVVNFSPMQRTVMSITRPDGKALLRLDSDGSLHLAAGVTVTNDL